MTGKGFNRLKIAPRAEPRGRRRGPGPLESAGRMATASRPRTAPAALRGEGLTAKARRALPALAVILGVPALLWLAYKPSYVNFDARYALLWARDIVHGHTPDYTAVFAPTPHPLQTLVSFPILLAGNGAAAKIMVALTLLALGFLTWFIYRLGAELWNPAVGIVAAVVVATRPSLDRFALIGYQDLAFAALVTYALLLETRKPKRGTAVLVTLAIAGLMRPDAWLLSLLYLAYLWRDTSDATRRAQLTALALTAPILWIAQDWIITGQPFHSLEGTKTLAGEVNRRRPPLTIPKRTGWYFKLLLLWPLVFGVPLGLAFAWLHARKRFALLVATAAALTAWIVLTSILGLSLIQRYLVTPGALLAVVYGLAVFGWMKLESQQRRQAWKLAGLAALVFSLAYIPAQASKLRSVKSTMNNEARNYADLKLVGQSAAVRARFKQCGNRISTIGHKAMPDLRWWLNAPPKSIDLVEGSKTKVGPLMLKPRATKQMWAFDRKEFAIVKPPPGYTRLYRNHSWVVYAAPGCGTGRLSAAPGGDVQADPG
jgi:hypothetical protein